MLHLKRYILLLLCGLALAAQAKTPRRFSYPTEPNLLMSPTWQRDFVRAPSEYDISGLNRVKPRNIFCAIVLAKTLTLDVRYLQNHSRAQMKFYDWYLDGDTTVTHASQLSQQHLESATGAPGAKQHYVHVTDVSSYPSENSKPGIFRFELLAQNRPHLGVDEFTTQPAQWENLARHGFERPQGSYRLRARDIPEPLQTDLEITGEVNRVKRVAPKRIAEEAFRAAASERMADLKKWKDLTPEQVRAKQDAFFNDLSDYYHTSIQWMPFSAINNSMLMGHVNVLLRHFGYEPIAHNGLDYLALMSHYDVYRGVFKEAILKANPPN